MAKMSWPDRFRYSARTLRSACGSKSANLSTWAANSAAVGDALSRSDEWVFGEAFSEGRRWSALRRSDLLEVDEKGEEGMMLCERSIRLLGPRGPPGIEGLTVTCGRDRTDAGGFFVSLVEVCVPLSKVDCDCGFLMLAFLLSDEKKLPALEGELWRFVTIRMADGGGTCCLPAMAG